MSYYRSLIQYGSVLDANVQAFITANGITDTTYINALNTCVLGLKSDGLYSGIQGWWIFYGNANQSKFNFINPVDTDAGNRLTYIGNYTVDNNGYLRFDGKTYINNNFIPSVMQDILSNGTTLISATNNGTPTTDTVDTGAFQGATQASILYVKNNTTNNARGMNMNGSSLFSTGTNEARGIFTAVKQSAILSKFIRNNSLIGTASGGGTLPTITEYINCMNLNGSAYGIANQRFLQKLKHIGFSDAQVTALHSRLDTFETALGRKTW